MRERANGGTIPHSDSMRDVLAVAPESTLVPKRDLLQSRSSGAVLVHESAHHHHSAIQEHENEMAEVVLVCEPEGTSLMMGGLHPRYASRRVLCVRLPGTVTAWSSQHIVTVVFSIPLSLLLLADAHLHQCSSTLL